MAGKLESKFQKELKDELRFLFPDCVITKLDPNDIQGIPDLLILYKDRWAVLECKRRYNSTHRPNQDHYVSLLDSMSFSRFIYPENKEEVLHELQRSFSSRRKTRISRS